MYVCIFYYVYTLLPDRAMRRDMRERRRDRPPEPPEPNKAPPPAPKPKPHPRGPPSVEDDLSEKGKADSINDSFEDIPDRRSKIERIHGVQTPLSMVLQKSMEEKEKSDHEHEDHDEHEDSNSHGPPGYSTDDPERREVGTRQDILHTNLSMPDINTLHHSLPDNTALSTPDIDHTNQSMYVFSYPSSIDSNMSEVFGDYDASKPLSVHRQRASSGSDITRKSRFKSDKLRNFVASIPQATTCKQYDKIDGQTEGIYAEVEGVKRGKNLSKDNIDKQVEAFTVTQPKIYGRRSKHFIKNQKQCKLSEKAPTPQPSLQTAAMSSLIPDKGQNTKPLPLYAKINKDLKLPDNASNSEERKQSPVSFKSLNSLPCKEDKDLKTEDHCPETNRERIREELKMYILVPQAKETKDNEHKSEEFHHENKQFTEDHLVAQSKELSKVSDTGKECDSILAEKKLSNKVSLTYDKSQSKGDAMRKDANLYTDLSDQRDGNQHSPYQTNITHDSKTDKDYTMASDMPDVLPLHKIWKVKPDANKAIREWVNNIDTSYEVDSLEEAEDKLHADDIMVNHHTEKVDVGPIIQCKSTAVNVPKNDATSELPLALSPAIVVSDCDKEQKTRPFINPYQIVFDSSIKVTLNADGQEIDFDSQLERFSNLSSGSSDVDLNVTDTLRVENDEKLERFSTVSSESSDLELKYGGKAKDDNDLSLEKFCSLSTDSSEGDLRISDAYSHGPHLAIPTKVLRQRHKKKQTQSDIRQEKKKTLESSDSSNSIEINLKDLKEKELSQKKSEGESHKNEIQLGVKIQDSGREIKGDGSVKPKQKFDSNLLPSYKIPDQSVAEQKLLKSPIDKDMEKSSPPQTLKKMKSKEKLGSSFSCMKARTTSPFEGHVQTKSEYQTEEVKIEKTRSVYQIVATQLSKPFGKRKSKDKLQSEDESINAGRRYQSIEASDSAGRSAPQNEIDQTTVIGNQPQIEMDKTTVIGNQSRTRFNKPDWFKTYLLPDDHISNSTPEPVCANATDSDLKKADANQDRKLSTKSESVEGISNDGISQKVDDYKTSKDHKIDVQKRNISSGLTRQTSKQNKSNDSDSKSDQMKVAKLSKKKVSPGVIHILNPCPSGWIEGGLETKLNTEEKNGKAEKVDDQEQGMKLKNAERKVQVSALDFELTKCPSPLDKANVSEPEKTNYVNNSYSNESADNDDPGMTNSLSASTGTTDFANVKDEKVSIPELTKSKLGDKAKVEVVEDRLCQRKWKYMQLKSRRNGSDGTVPDHASQYGKMRANDLPSKKFEKELKNTNSPTCTDNPVDEKMVAMEVTHNIPSVKGSPLVKVSNKNTIEEFAIDHLQKKMIIDNNDSNLTHFRSPCTSKEGCIDRTERKIIVENAYLLLISLRPKETKLDELCDNKSVISSVGTKSDIVPEAKSEQLFGHSKDPMDDGSIPFADEEVADIVLQEEVNIIIPEANSNAKEFRLNNKLSEESANAKELVLNNKISEENTNTKKDEKDHGVNNKISEENATAKNIRLNNKMFEDNPNAKENTENLESLDANETQKSIDDSRCPEFSLDTILCECNVKPDKRFAKTGTILTISSKWSKHSLTENSQIGHLSEHNDNKTENLTDNRVSETGKVAVRPDIPHNHSVADGGGDKIGKFEVDLDQMCSDETEGTILCECNFKSVPVTDLDGASWYENNVEIETVCSYTDDKVPVIIDDSPYVPKKRILKSSYSAENLSRGSHKKGVRFHANLPTWKKISWRSESNLRRMKTVYGDEEDDEMDKKKYIENFIMCMFDQEPRNRSLVGDEFSVNGSFGKQESEGDINKTEKQVENLETVKQKPSLQLFYFDKEGNSKLEDSKPLVSEEQVAKLDRPWESKDDFENDSYDIHSKPTFPVTAEIVPDSVSSDLIGELEAVGTVNDEKSPNNELSSMTKLKQPSVIAKQPKPYGPKFFVPVSHSRSQGACGVEPSFVQAGDMGIGTSYPEKYESFHLPFSRRSEPSTSFQNSADDKVNSFEDYDFGDPDTSKIAIIDATTCDVTKSEIIRTKPLTDWRTYLKSYEQFRKKMDSSVGKKADDEGIECKYGLDKISLNVKDYADVSLISSKNSLHEDNSPIITTENYQAAAAINRDLAMNKDEKILDSGDIDFAKAETDKHETEKYYTDTMSLSKKNVQQLQPDKNLGSEYEMGRNIAQTNTDTCHTGYSPIESRVDKPPTDEVVPDSPSTYPGKTTRYVFTVPDESDPESPRIKSVTYEYITEYRLNKVEVDYQHSKKVQTDTEALPSTDL